MSSPYKSHAATLQAFYTCVIHRVCSLYQEKSEAATDKVIARLQQKWQEKLMLYTGKHGLSNTVAQDDDVAAVDLVGLSSEKDCDSDSDGFLSSSSSSSSLSCSSPDSAFVSEQAIGRPSKQLPSAATSMTSSIFAKMLGGKRKLHQLDGSVSGAENSVKWKEAADLERQDSQQQSTETVLNSSTVLEDLIGEDEDNLASELNYMAYHKEEEVHITCDEEGNEVEDWEHHEEPSVSPTNSAMSASSLVSSDDLAPVFGLSGINLPLQFAAEYSEFSHRGKHRGYVGKLHAIVLTWPKRLGARDRVHLGEVLWHYPDSAPGLIDEGELVKVISVADNQHEVMLELGNGKKAVVSMERIYRLSEYLIRDGSVQFHSK